MGRIPEPETEVRQVPVTILVGEEELRQTPSGEILCRHVDADPDAEWYPADPRGQGGEPGYHALHAAFLALELHLLAAGLELEPMEDPR